MLIGRHAKCFAALMAVINECLADNDARHGGVAQQL
jgi:hypothetical protein